MIFIFASFHDGKKRFIGPFANPDVAFEWADTELEEDDASWSLVSPIRPDEFVLSRSS